MFGRSKLRQIWNRHRQESHTEKAQQNEGYNKYVGKKNDNNNNHKFNNAFARNNSTPTTQFFHYNDTVFDFVKTHNGHEVNYQSLDIFHRAVCPILVLGQLSAVMPVVGVTQPSPRNLRFRVQSPQTVLVLVFLAGNSLLTLATTRHVLQIGLNAKNVVGIVFFVCSQSACLLFLSLAPRWPHIMRYWTKTELVFTRKPYEKPKRNLARRVRLAALAIIVLSVVEHGFYLGSAVYSYQRRTYVCGSLSNTSTNIYFEDFMRENYAYVFNLLPYNVFIGIFLIVINAACTFIWNYMDLFIMMVSKGIAYRFEQMTMRINKLLDKDVPESVFIEIRGHYVELCELLEYIDENFSGIILLSSMNNLYFICYQLLNIFNKLRWPINYIYFWYSLLYLIGRTTFVYLSAASINDESKSSLSVLRQISSKSWCIEVERLISQMSTQTIALSGKKFYFLTRRLLFGMAGTIITYELVLLQFDEPNRSKGLPELCS